MGVRVRLETTGLYAKTCESVQTYTIQYAIQTPKGHSANRKVNFVSKVYAVYPTHWIAIPCTGLPFC